MTRDDEKDETKPRESSGRGRPPLSKQGQNEVLHMLLPTEVMQEVREVTRKHGATLAGFVRLAIQEKLEREREDA